MPPYALDKSAIQRLIEAEAMRQGLNPALVVAIAKQESWLNPNAVGDNGKSLGLFQLQRAAAIDAGIDPNRRGELHENIRGGVTYFKQKLQQSGGNVEQALSRYNRGTPTYRGIGDPHYVENVLGQMERGAPRQGLLARIGRAISPASAEAAPASRIDELVRAVGGPQAGAPRPQEPSPAAPTEPPEPGAAPRASRIDELIQALGGTAAAPAAAPPQAPSLLARLGQAAETAVQTVPIAGQLYPLVKPIVQAQYGPQLEELPRAGAAGALSAGGTWAGARLGGLAGMPFGPAGVAVGTGLGAIAGSYATRRANVGLGLEDPGMFGDVLSIAAPAVQAGWSGLKGIGKALVGRSRGWQALKEADEATAAAQKTYQEGVATAEQQYAREQAEYQARTRAAEAERLQKVQQRRTIAEERQTAQEARREEGVAQRQSKAVEEAETATQQQAREYAEQVQRYEQAVASQQQAVPQARAIPSRYTPETPAHVLYKKVADIAPEAPVTLTRTQEVAAELQDVLSQVPSLQPSRLQSLLTDVRAARSTQSVREVQRYLSDIGLLTRSNDSATRRTARQLYGALHDDLAESATRLPETEAARDLLLQANATFRREMATRDLAGVVRRAITVGDDGIPRLAPGRLLTQFDRLVEGDRFFAGSFTPDELAQLRGELAGLTTAQKIPPRPGAQPTPVTPKRVEPYTPRPFQEPTIPAGERVVPQTTPQERARIPQRPEPGPPPEPVPPKLEPRDVTALQNVLRGAGVLDVLLGGIGPVAVVAGAREAKGQLADGLAKMIIDPRFRPYMQRILNVDGSLNRQALITLAGGRAALLALLREDKEKGR